ncbi:hypothetical protein ACIQVL_48540 [Streptomyces sp. NPDC090499]|uniref:hypothetical protein n=1 Tax=Streptomyces sp. NPDC090499 TaxID=3365965 RepID=UPI0037FEDC71
MTTELPDTAPVPSGEGAGVDDAGFEAMRTDAVLTGRAMSSGEYLAGLMVAAELDVVGSPTKLPTVMWADLDPAVVQAIFNHGAAVATRVAQFAGAPWLYRDRLQALQGRLTEAGFHAMAGSVGRSVRLVVPEDGVHPADGQIAREH